MKITKRRGTVGAILTVLVVIFIVGLISVGIWQGWSNYVVDSKFNAQIGGYFDLADQTSNATTKLHYWNQFAHALQANGLTSGWAVHDNLFCMGCGSNQEYNLSASYEANVISIQSRLQALVDSCRGNFTCQSSFAYTQSLNQIENTEICWFPINYFQQGYEMQQGVPLAGQLGPPSNNFLCSTSTHT